MPRHPETVPSPRERQDADERKNEVAEKLFDAEYEGGGEDKQKMYEASGQKLISLEKSLDVEKKRRREVKEEQKDAIALEAANLNIKELENSIEALKEKRAKIVEDWQEEKAA